MLRFVPPLVLLLTTAVFAELPVTENAVESRLQSDLKYLSADERDGRGVGTEGLDEAAAFIRDEFRKMGLDVTAVDGGAYQTFDFPNGSEPGTDNRLTWTITSDDEKGEKQKATIDEDFVVTSFSESEEFSGEPVFVGYGIEAPKKNYNEFDTIDVKDRVVIIMRRVPREGVANSPFAGPHGGMTRESSLSSKVSNAYRNGAKAVLFVNSPNGLTRDLEKEREEIQTLIDGAVEDGEDAVADRQRAALKALDEAGPVDALMKFGYGGDNSKNLPIGQVTVDLANEWLKASVGKTLAEIEAEINEDLKPQVFELNGVEVDAKFSIVRKNTQVKNVIGVWEGEGPHKDETIVIGAHYDHVGMGGFGSLLPGSKAVHNGADDNGSGTVALLETARQLTKDGKRYGRRLVFMAFTVEERGLIGSAYYTNNPVFPIEKTVAMVNMDMVGRLRENKLTVYGTGTAKIWPEMLNPLGDELDLNLIFKPEGFGPSDHSSFYAKRIPVLFFFTGLHGDYHRPSDDWDKINYSGIRRVVTLAEQVITDIATRDDRPEYIEVKGSANVARTGDRPYFGSIPDFGSNKKGYAISGVASGSPADRGGLKGGDHIIELQGNKIGNLDDFDLALRKFSVGEKVKVTVDRDGEKKVLEVRLGKPK